MRNNDAALRWYPLGGQIDAHADPTIATHTLRLLLPGDDILRLVVCSNVGLHRTGTIRRRQSTFHTDVEIPAFSH